MSAVASPLPPDLSPLPSLLAALCEVLKADLDTDAASLLLFIALKRGVSAKSIIDHNYRRPREALRKGGLIVWKVGMVVLTDEGAEVVRKISDAAAAKSELREVDVA